MEMAWSHLRGSEDFYIRNQSTVTDVLYSAMSSKSIEELKEMTIRGSAKV